MSKRILCQPLNVLNPFLLQKGLKEGMAVTIEPIMYDLPICVSSILTLLSSIGVYNAADSQ